MAQAPEKGVVDTFHLMHEGSSRRQWRAQEVVLGKCHVGRSVNGLQPENNVDRNMA